MAAVRLMPALELAPPPADGDPVEWPERTETVVPAATAAAAATDAAMNMPRRLLRGRWAARWSGRGAAGRAWLRFAIAKSRAARPLCRAAGAISSTRPVEDSSSSRAFMMLLPG